MQQTYRISNNCCLLLIHLNKTREGLSQPEEAEKSFIWKTLKFPLDCNLLLEFMFAVAAAGGWLA